jgi:hypothetical protein
MKDFEQKLDEALLLEMPHMIWLDNKEPKTIPGTDLTFETGFDFRIERYSPEDYARINMAITRDGVVGYVKGTIGGWVFFKQTARDPIMRIATVQEVNELEHLPDDWQENLALDTASV